MNGLGLWQCRTQLRKSFIHNTLSKNSITTFQFWGFNEMTVKCLKHFLISCGPSSLHLFMASLLYSLIVSFDLTCALVCPCLISVSSLLSLLFHSPFYSSKTLHFDFEYLPLSILTSSKKMGWWSAMFGHRLSLELKSWKSVARSMS